MSLVQELGLEWVATDRNAALATAEYADRMDSPGSHIDWVTSPDVFETYVPMFGELRLGGPGEHLDRLLAVFTVLSVVPAAMVVIALDRHRSPVNQGQP